MKTFLRFTALLLAVLLTIPVAGQSLQAYEEKAEEAHEQKNYSASLAYHKILLDVDPQRTDALFRGGEAAYHLQAFTEAKKLLEAIPDSLKNGPYATTDFILGMAQKGLAEYNEAAESFKRFIKTHPPDSRLEVAQAKKEMEWLVWAMEEYAYPTGVEVTCLGDNVNTGNADFAPMRFADKLYFTSSYVSDTSLSEVMRIYSSIQDDPAQLSEINTNDSTKHSSHFSLTSDAQRLYYTICENGAYINSFRCEIYYRDKTYDGSWGPAVPLPRHINIDTCTTTQPAVGFVKKFSDEGMLLEQKEMLFFASDRPGGKGGMDIWACEIEQDYGGEVTGFGTPYALDINTPQDDITPFFHSPSQTLYFSSNGREGLGGADVFSTKMNADGNWEEPTNLGYPLNTSYDENYYTFHSGSRQAYFSSNRPGSTCADSSLLCICPDIYTASFNVGLDVWTWNDVDSSSLSEVRVELYDVTLNLVDTFYVNPTGNKFFFPLELEREYKITGSLEGFSTAYAEVDTRGLSHAKVFERDLYLRPGVELIVRTFNEIDSTELYGTTVDLGGGATLQHVNDDFSNTCSFRLEYGKNYTIEGSKPKYLGDNATASTVGMNRPDTIYRDLYLSPFTGLPLVLCYDNDKPRYLASWQENTTELTYEETYQAYMRRKPTFLSRCTDATAMGNFLRDTVEANYAKLQDFCNMLESYLQDGNDIEILIAGYASPLADSIYNRHLTSRRISCLENHFYEVNEGALSEYIDGGQLQINRDPRGEVNPNNTSDDEAQPQHSIYSPGASWLRRVTITEIRAQQRGAPSTSMN